MLIKRPFRDDCVPRQYDGNFVENLLKIGDDTTENTNDYDKIFLFAKAAKQRMRQSVLGIREYEDKEVAPNQHRILFNICQETNVYFNDNNTVNIDTKDNDDNDDNDVDIDIKDNNDNHNHNNKSNDAMNVDNGNQYIPHSILNHRYDNTEKILKYEVFWDGYDISDENGTSWEPCDELMDKPIFQEYVKKHNIDVDKYTPPIDEKDEAFQDQLDDDKRNQEAIFASYTNNEDAYNQLKNGPDGYILEFFDIISNYDEEHMEEWNNMDNQQQQAFKNMAQRVMKCFGTSLPGQENPDVIVTHTVCVQAPGSQYNGQLHVDLIQQGLLVIVCWSGEYKAKPRDTPHTFFMKTGSMYYDLSTKNWIYPHQFSLEYDVWNFRSLIGPIAGKQIIQFVIYTLTDNNPLYQISSSLIITPKNAWYDINNKLSKENSIKYWKRYNQLRSTKAASNSYKKKRKKYNKSKGHRKKPQPEIYATFSITMNNGKTKIWSRKSTKKCKNQKELDQVMLCYLYHALSQNDQHSIKQLAKEIELQPNAVFSYLDKYKCCRKLFELLGYKLVYKQNEVVVE